MEDSDVEVDVKMEVDEFDAFDSMQTLMQTDTEAEYISPPPPQPPLPPSVKATKYNLRRDRSTVVKAIDVQPKIESVFLEDGEFQAAPYVADFSIDRIKSECDSNVDDNGDADNGDDCGADQDGPDWQSDENDIADEIVEVKYKKKRQHCPKCSMSYSKREYLAKHMKREHDAELEKKRPGKTNERCNQCNAKYRNYAKHMLKKHGIDCNATSVINVKTELDSLDNSGHHENQSNEIVNVQPSETMQNNPPKVETEQPKIGSDESNDNGNENSMLQKTLKRKNAKSKDANDPNDDSTRCIPCNRKFHDMPKHWVQYHSGLERPFECYVCHRNYKRFEHIKYHLKTHGDERNYQCHVCGDSFFLSNELRKHFMYRHQVERPFKCTHPQCKKAFKNMHALNIHMRTHSGAKPFRCKHSLGGVACSEAFAALSSLRIHERKHTGEKVKSIDKCVLLHIVRSASFWFALRI